MGLRKARIAGAQQPEQPAATGLLLWAPRAGDIDRLLLQRSGG